MYDVDIPYLFDEEKVVDTHPGATDKY